MKKIVFLIIVLLTAIATSQNLYLNQNGVEITKKEFRKLKRTGRDSLMAISSYDQEINELFLKRKPVNISNAKDEIISINQITGNNFDTETPLLVLYYPSIEEATFVRDEILYSKHWYTYQNSIIFKSIKNNLGNTLIVSAPNGNGIELPGIYNDDLLFFQLTYFNSNIATPSFLWISEENTFTEPIDFIQNYTVINTKKHLRVTKDSSPDSLVTVDKNLKKIDLSTFSKPISRIEYLNLDEGQLFKVIHEDQRETKIDTVLRNSYAQYFTELTGQTIKRNDTIILDFHLYTNDYEDFYNENQSREQLQDKVDKYDSIKLVWMAQAGSLYIPEGCVYDIKDAVRKGVSTFGPAVNGVNLIIYPDGKLYTLDKEHSDNLNLRRLRNGKENFLRKSPNRKPITLLLSKEEIKPPKIFNPSK